MSISQSDKYYFPRGDLVLQVENILFKLHRDILERHSGFFEDMFSLPTSDDTEGTESDPLVLPKDLCSARTFTILCKYLYPQKMAFPRVLAKNAEEWEAVLKATASLQMQTIREHIWAGLNQDTSNIKFNAAKLLRLSMEYEEAPRSFIVACLRVLGYRCGKISLNEVRILGEKATWLVNHTREKVRESLLMIQAELIRPRAMNMNGLECNEHPGCKKAVFRRIIPNLSNNKSQKTDDASDIFQLNGDRELCQHCIMFQNAYVLTLKLTLNDVVEGCANELLSPSSAAHPVVISGN